MAQVQTGSVTSRATMGTSFIHSSEPKIFHEAIFLLKGLIVKMAHGKLGTKILE